MQSPSLFLRHHFDLRMRNLYATRAPAGYLACSCCSRISSCVWIVAAKSGFVNIHLLVGQKTPSTYLK